MKQHLLFILFGIAMLMPAKLFADDIIPVARLSSDETTLTFTYDEEHTATATNGNAGTYKLNTVNDKPGWTNSKVTTVIFDKSFANARPTSTYAWFLNMHNLRTIQGIENLNTSEVTNMCAMFYKCSSLRNIYVSNFNTTKVTSMKSMFYGCSMLTYLNVSNFNTANVTKMSYMFYGCSSLESLDLRNFNTANVTEMKLMFRECSSLKSLDVSSFNTANVTDMGGMFQDCSRLTSLDVSNFNTSKVTSIAGMFFRCSKLKSLNIGDNDFKSYVEGVHVFFNVGTKSSPCLLYIGNNFHTSVMHYECDSIYSWYEGYFKLRAKVQSIILSSTSHTMTVGQSYDPKVKVVPKFAIQKLNITSDNESVAKVDPNGVITALAVGVTDIRYNATDDSGVSAVCHVIVCRKAESMNLENATLRLKKGETYTGQSVIILPADANQTQELYITSEDETIATVDSAGAITGVGTGRTNIKYETSDGSELKATCEVTVYSPTTSISLSKTEISLLRGKTYRQPTITILPSDASQDLAYSSSDESVAMVDENGLITAVGYGEAVITYAAKDGTDVKATCKVYVFSASLTTTTMSLRKGASYNQQTITITPSSLSDSVKLTAVSEDESIATVDSDGIISAIDPGVANIDYLTDQGDTAATCRVIVYAENVAYVGGLYYLLEKPAAPQATVTSIYGGEEVDETTDSVAQYYSGTINIPETVTYDGKTYGVTHVGKYSFYYQNSLQAIIIPKTITEVETKAAEKSSSLRLVTVADGSQLVTIGTDAFRDCKSLQRVTFNGTTQKMRSIDSRAFQDCSSLQRVIWRGNSSLKTIDDYTFYRCTKLNHFQMPDNVTHIGKHAFRYGESLKDIHLSTALSIIDEYAFGECGFSNITLPESLASAQAGAFINEPNLTSITIPERVEGLGAACFENNAVLDTVTFRTSIHTMTIGNNAFNLCPKITRVNITHMDSWAETNFNNDKANPANTAHHIYMNGKEVTEVVLPQGTLYVNSNAFNGCTAITSVDMPSTIGHVNDDIFTGCTSLTDVYCRATDVPLFIGVNDPSAMNDVFNRATLHVPNGCESDYKADSWWGRFYKIEGFDAAGISSIRIQKNGECVYYDLDGHCLGSKVLEPGVYIRVNGGKSEKVVINRK